MPDEGWRDIPGVPGYQACRAGRSAVGRVRSLDRTLTDGRTAGGVELKPYKDGKGYWCVTLMIAGERVKVRVHRILKVTFTGPPRGKQVRHLQDDKDDLRLESLRYGTQRDNERDKKRNNRRKEGFKGKEGIGRQIETAEASRVPHIVSPGLTEGSR